MGAFSYQRRWWLAFIGALMLFTCTPPPRGYPARFVRYGQQVYVSLLAWKANQDLQPGIPLPLENLARWDAETASWSYVVNEQREALPKSLIQALRTLPETYPRQDCAPDTGQWCLRILRLCSEVVELSRDGGTTWEIGWWIPPRRRDFFARAQRWPPNSDPHGLCALDVVWVVNAAGEPRAFVSLGREGLLVFQPPATWERKALARGSPTPLRFSGIEALIFVLPEGILVALLAPWLTRLLASQWVKVPSMTAASSPPVLTLLNGALGLMGMALLCFAASFGVSSQPLAGLLVLLALGLAGIGFVLYPWGWLQFLTTVWEMGAAGRWLVLQHLLLMVVFPVVLWLWAVGVWPLTYWETIAATLLGLILTGWQAYRRSQITRCP